MKKVLAAGRRSRRFTTVLVSMALIAGGCTSAVVTSSSVPSITPPSTPSAAAPTDSTITVATDSLGPRGSSSARAIGPGDPLPVVSQATTATWKGIRWTALPATPAFGANVPTTEGSTFQVFGWSGGYVGFTITPSQPVPGGTDSTTGEQLYDLPASVVVPSYSTDGVHWHSGGTLDTSKVIFEPSQVQIIRDVIEGPGGLLAVGWTGSCGSSYLDSLWTSSDGKTWKPVDLPKTMTTQLVTRISGGGAGYVAVAYDNAGAWTSKDGRTWQFVQPSAGPFANSKIDDGTAISGAFVLAGTAGIPSCGAMAGVQPRPVARTAAVWRSIDGSTWTKIALPGAIASSGYQTASIYRLSDQHVVVTDPVCDAGTCSVQSWTSTDGRTWAQMKLPAGLDLGTLVSQGRHHLAVSPSEAPGASGDQSPVVGRLGLSSVTDDLTVLPIEQSGDLPEILYSNFDFGTYGLVAVGPTGVVVTDPAGTQIWFGAPAAN